MSPAKRRRLGYRHEGWGRYVYDFVDGRRAVVYKTVEDRFIRITVKTPDGKAFSWALTHGLTLQGALRAMPHPIWEDRLLRKYGGALPWKSA
jgi:hypothetical protein